MKFSIGLTQLMRWTTNVIFLERRAAREIAAGAPCFQGKPDGWWEAHRWRCPNDHVSPMYLKTEAHGALCISCQGPLVLTFPADKTGTLDTDEVSGHEEPALGDAKGTCKARLFVGRESVMSFRCALPEGHRGLHTAVQDSDGLAVVTTWAKDGRFDCHRHGLQDAPMCQACLDADGEQPCEHCGHSAAAHGYAPGSSAGSECDLCSCAHFLTTAERLAEDEVSMGKETRS